MKTTVGLVVAVLLLGAASVAAADTHDALIKDAIACYKQIAATLATAKDEASIKGARPKLKTLSTQLRGIKKRFETLGPPNEEQEKDLEKKYGKEFEEANLKLAVEYARLEKLPGGPDLLKEIRPQPAKPTDKKSDK
jgi:hypothetical protein